MLLAALKKNYRRTPTSFVNDKKYRPHPTFSVNLGHFQGILGLKTAENGQKIDPAPHFSLPYNFEFQKIKIPPAP